MDCGIAQNEVLVEIKKKYGDQISILSIDNSEKQGSLLFLKTLVKFRIPLGKQLPLVMVGKDNLSGLAEISNQLPGMIKTGLEQGGTDWPDVEGFTELITKINKAPNLSSNHRFISNESNMIKTQLDLFAYQYQKDMTGNIYAIWVLIGLLGCVILSVLFIIHGKSQVTGQSQLLLPTVFLFMGVIVAEHLANIQSILSFTKILNLSGDSWLALLVLLLVALSFGSTLFVLVRKSQPVNLRWFKWMPVLLLMICFACAGYLFSSGITQSEAVCGAVGDCNAVQQSPYAVLFGILPISLLGILGTIAITAAWFSYYFGKQSLKNYSGLVFYGFSLFGTLFFIYLTFLEPFVIGATCFWCLTTAIAMSILMLIATPAGITSWKNLR